MHFPPHPLRERFCHDPYLLSGKNMPNCARTRPHRIVFELQNGETDSEKKSFVWTTNCRQSTTKATSAAAALSKTETGMASMIIVCDCEMKTLGMNQTEHDLLMSGRTNPTAYEYDGYLHRVKGRLLGMR